ASRGAGARAGQARLGWEVGKGAGPGTARDPVERPFGELHLSRGAGGDGRPLGGAETAPELRVLPYANDVHRHLSFSAGCTMRTSPEASAPRRAGLAVASFASPCGPLGGTLGNGRRRTRPLLPICLACDDILRRRRWGRPNERQRTTRT